MIRYGSNSFSKTASGRYWAKKFAERKEQNAIVLTKKNEMFVPWKTILNA